MSFIIPALVFIYTSGIKYFVANPFEAAWTWRNGPVNLGSPGTIRAFWNTLVVSRAGERSRPDVGTPIAWFIYWLKRRRIFRR